MAAVEIGFLGSADALGSGGRLQTSFHIKTPSLQILIDCGATSFAAMKRWGIDPSRIEMVFLSHLRGDHFAGIPFLILDGQFSRRRTALIIAGPPGVERRIRETQEVLFPCSSQGKQRFAIQYAAYHDRELFSWPAVSVLPVLHPSGSSSFALRIATEGKIIAYSGDTEWAEALIEAAHGADLFICEADCFDNKTKYHLDGQTIFEQRPRLNCRRLILTDMQEEMLLHRGEISMEYAEDGKRLVLE
jgi:ribonuclease BN (tRNA processing enzyme)